MLKYSQFPRQTLKRLRSDGQKVIFIEKEEYIKEKYI